MTTQFNNHTGMNNTPETVIDHLQTQLATSLTFIRKLNKHIGILKDQDLSEFIKCLTI